MAECRVKARPHLVKYQCDKCHQGYVRPTGAVIVAPSGQHSYEHVCLSCGEKIRLPHPYPCVVWESEGQEILRSPL